MNDPSAVDAYLGRLLGHDPALTATLAANAVAGLPDIDVSPLQGRMLTLFATMVGARRILEVGTLGGYSTICLARVLPAEGQLVTLEIDPHHAATARANVDRAGVGGRVEIRVGPAADTLAKMVEAGENGFDLIFIDADKANNVRYLHAAMALGRPGAMIVVDNVVRGGEVANPAATDPGVIGSRALIAAVAAEPRLIATAVQTVGVKQWDGFMLARIAA